MCVGDVLRIRKDQVIPVRFPIYTQNTETQKLTANRNKVSDSCLISHFCAIRNIIYYFSGFKWNISSCQHGADEALNI